MIKRYTDWYCKLDDNKWGGAILSLIFLPLCVAVMFYVVVIQQDEKE